MKRAIYAMLAVTTLTLLTGCLSYPGRRPLFCLGGSCAQAPENCASCSCGTDTCQDPGQEVPCRECAGRDCRLCRRAIFSPRGYESEPAAGPTTGTITYPYYTTRGPRDFLARNPQSIGP